MYSRYWLRIQLELAKLWIWLNLQTIHLACQSFFNANYADGIDTSWIWDANFESILDMDIPEINAGGVRHSEIARRLRVTGYPEDKITQAEKLEDIMTLIEKQDCDHAYILATYTAMLEFRDILAQRHAVGKGMN